MRNKNLEMQELNDAAELLAQVKGATLQTSYIGSGVSGPSQPCDPIRPIFSPPFSQMYGIWTPTDRLHF